MPSVLTAHLGPRMTATCLHCGKKVSDGEVFSRREVSAWARRHAGVGHRIQVDRTVTTIYAGQK